MSALTWHQVVADIDARIADLQATCCDLGASVEDIRAAQAGIRELERLKTLPTRLATSATHKAQHQGANRTGY